MYRYVESTETTDQLLLRNKKKNVCKMTKENNTWNKRWTTSFDYRSWFCIKERHTSIFDAHETNMNAQTKVIMGENFMIHLLHTLSFTLFIVACFKNSMPQIIQKQQSIATPSAYIFMH